MTPSLVVGGTRLETIGAYSEVTWETLADGGCGDITWSMQLPTTSARRQLCRGQLVQVKAGARNVCAGILAEPDINTDDDGGPTWSFTASGLYTAASGFLAFDSAGNTTSTPDVAIDAAIARGLPWGRLASLSAAPFTDANDDGSDVTDSLNKVSDLLNAWAPSVSKRWGVDADGNVWARTDPTTPTWHMTPGSGRFGLADDDYASAVYVRYMTAAGTYATASATDSEAAAQYGAQEYGEDATGFGVLTSAQATGLAQGALNAGKARLGWTNPLSPTRWQITTPGGTPASLWMVRAGQMVRLHGVRNEQGQPMPYVDFVIGKASYDSSSDALTISPVGLADRDLTSVLAAAVGAAS